MSAMLIIMWPEAVMVMSMLDMSMEVELAMAPLVVALAMSMWSMMAVVFSLKSGVWSDDNQRGSVERGSAGTEDSLVGEAWMKWVG